MKTGFGLILIAALLLLNRADAQDSLGMRGVSSLDYWLDVHGIQVVDDLAYIGSCASGLHVLDLTDPAHPSEIGRHAWQPWSYDWVSAYVSGNRAFVTFYDGVMTLDISNPNRAVQLGYWECYKAPQIVFARGNVGVASWDEGYPGLVDLSDLNNIQPTGEFDLPYNAWPVGMVGDYLCVCGWGGLSMIDISDPWHPQEVVRADSSTDSYAATLAGNYIYRSTYARGVRILDVSDPLHPTYVASFDSLNCGTVTVSGNYALVQKERGLNIWNLSDMHDPVLECSYQPNATFYQMAVKGTMLYAAVSGSPSALSIIDFSHPAAPVQIGTYGTIGWPKEMVVRGSAAYMADDYTGVRIANLEDPMHLSNLGAGNFAAQPGPVDIALMGDFAYLAAEDSGLAVYNVRDPVMPQFIHYVHPQPMHNAFRVLVKDSFAYVLDNRHLLHAFSLAQPAEPVWTDSLPLPNLTSYQCWMKEVNDYLYVATEETYIITLSARRSPQLVSTWHHYIGDCAASGHYLFAANNGIMIYDVSDPLNPLDVAWVDGSAYGVTVSGNKLFVTDNRGLRMFDITDPLNPVSTGFYTTHEGIAAMQVYGPYLLTMSQTGLRMYQCDGLNGTHSPSEHLPAEFALRPAYPNPFNPTTTIRFSLPANERATLKIFDVTGRHVTTLTDGVLNAGEHKVTFDGSALSSGVYFARLEDGKNMRTQKLMLIR